MAAIGRGIDGTDANTTTTGGLAQEVQTYYDKVFLARAEYEWILQEGGQQRTHPANSGRTVNFTRYNPLTIITSPLGEASNPVTCSINASTVAMTLSEYGLTTTHGRLLTTVSIDSAMKEKVALVGQNMGIRKFAHVKLSLNTLERLKQHSSIAIKNYDEMATRGKQPELTGVQPQRLSEITSLMG